MVRLIDPFCEQARAVRAKMTLSRPISPCVLSNFRKVLTEHAADAHCRRLPACQSPSVAVVVLAGVWTWYRIRTKGSSKWHQGQARR